MWPHAALGSRPPKARHSAGGKGVKRARLLTILTIARAAAFLRIARGLAKIKKPGFAAAMGDLSLRFSQSSQYSESLFDRLQPPRQFRDDYQCCGSVELLFRALA